MHVLAVHLLIAFASAFAVPEPAYQIAQPGSSVKRIEATSGPVRLEGLRSDTNIVVSIALVTGAPKVDLVAVGDSDAPLSPACTPSSICFDGMTCGLRYGGYVVTDSSRGKGI